MKFNYRAFLAILSLVIVIYFIDKGLYETIMKSNTSNTELGNFMMIKIAEIFQFPSNLFISARNDYYILGIIINLCLYSLLIYIALKLIFRIYHYNK